MHALEYPKLVAAYTPFRELLSKLDDGNGTVFGTVLER